MSNFENDAHTRPGFHPGSPVVSSDGSISAFRSGNTSAIRALETIVEPGTLIDGFEIGRLIGRGGIAAVYEGVQRDTERPVAIKILDARFASADDIVSKFLAEGESLSAFDHPNIVKFIECGRDETFVYIAMELVKGINLDQLIHAIKLEDRHYLRLIQEISKGLTRMHAEGMIHGDIKPSNIMVTRPGEVKISDFGTAARMCAAGNARGAGNKVTGTSAYMAPELFDRSQNVDHRADIYSLGVTFYKVFTGVLPADQWVPPSTLNPALPLGLDAVVFRALQDKADDRYVTVKEFSDALGAFFEDTDQSATSVTAPTVYTTAASRVTVSPSKPENDTKTSTGIDWKLVFLCALAIIGITALVIAFIVYTNLYS